MDSFTALAPSPAPPAKPRPDAVVDVLAHGAPRAAPPPPLSGLERAHRLRRQAHGAAVAVKVAERLADAGLIQLTAHAEPRTTTAATPGMRTMGQWWCRVCAVECGGRDAFREHCMSDQHYDGLQLFALTNT